MAVIGFLVELGSITDNLLTSVLIGIREIAEPGTCMETRPLNFTDLKASLEGHQIMRYNGSLTTPPCAESISWWISTRPLSIGVDIFQMAKRVIKFNSRYTQNKLGGVNLLQNAANELNCDEKRLHADVNQKIMD
jgi:carbonic anhydrase